MSVRDEESAVVERRRFMAVCWGPGATAIAMLDEAGQLARSDWPRTSGLRVYDLGFRVEGLTAWHAMLRHSLSGCAEARGLLDGATRLFPQAL